MGGDDCTTTNTILTTFVTIQMMYLARRGRVSVPPSTLNIHPYHPRSLALFMDIHFIHGDTTLALYFNLHRLRNNKYK